MWWARDLGSPGRKTVFPFADYEEDTSLFFESLVSFWGAAELQAMNNSFCGRNRTVIDSRERNREVLSEGIELIVNPNLLNKSFHKIQFTQYLLNTILR